MQVWRWEATDMKTLGEKFDKEKDHIILEVPHGILQMEHDVRCSEIDKSAYACMKLKI